MAKIMVIVDCQKDFIDGSLGTPEAQAMIPRLVDKINAEPADTHFVFTADTHNEDYLNTPEGKQLPVKHCIKDSDGWRIDSRLTEPFAHSPFVIEKPTFGSVELMDWLSHLVEPGDEIEFVGLVSNICVISNVLLAKAYFPNNVISADKNCCAGTTLEAHEYAFSVMKSCQIIVKE